MGVYKKAFITEAGEALAARAVSGEVTIQFSHAKTSSYTYPEGTNFKKLAELQDVKQTVIPSNVQIENETLINIRSMFDNSKITQEYLIQNLGIYASDGETEILFAVCPATTPDQMPVFNGIAPSSFIYNVQISIAQAEHLSISVSTAGTATVQDVIDLDEKKVDASGGDISETVTMVEEPASIVDKYPEISGKGSIKTVLGKLLRWARSLKEDKVDKSEGDIASTKVASLQASTVQYPVPEAGDTTKVIIGKIKKFFEDIRNATIGACYIGQIVNNCVTKRADLPLAAEQGEVLMNLYTVLNANKLEILALESFSTSTNVLGNTAIFRRYPNGMKSLRIYGTITNNGLIVNNKYDLGSVGGVFLPFEEVVKRVIYTSQGNVGLLEYTSQGKLFFTPISVPSNTGTIMRIYEMYY